MLNKAIIFIISLFLLSSCITGPEGYFKKSANNRLFDRAGAKGKKRAPIYNKKYIAKAKQNVAINDFDDDDIEDSIFESENISQANREMYRAMLEEEVENKYLGKKESKNKPYPTVIRTNPLPVNDEETDSLELRAELNQIKSMLNETKNQMANYRCPTATELERAQAKLKAQNKVEQQLENDIAPAQTRTKKAESVKSI